MPLDATVAGATANSYLTRADADALAASDYGPERDTWTAAVDADCDLALQRATREIDDAVRSGWYRYSSAQALRFPREIDYVGLLPFIPGAIKRATYYQAAFLLRNARVIAGADTRRARDMQNASEPNVSYTREELQAPILSLRTLHALEGYVRAGGTRGLRMVRIASGYVA